MPVGPIIVLTYEHAGADRLHELLAAHPALVCLSGPGPSPAQRAYRRILAADRAAAGWAPVGAGAHRDQGDVRGDAHHAAGTGGLYPVVPT